jgi:hypothetical protein
VSQDCCKDGKVGCEQCLRPVSDTDARTRRAAVGWGDFPFCVADVNDTQTGTAMIKHFTDMLLLSREELQQFATEPKQQLHLTLVRLVARALPLACARTLHFGCSA